MQCVIYLEIVITGTFKWNNSLQILLFYKNDLISPQH